MATLFNKPTDHQNLKKAYDEMGIQMSVVQVIFDNLKTVEKKIKELSGKTNSNLNTHAMIKGRKFMFYAMILLEAIISVRAFGFLLHGMLNIPMTRMMWVVDFIVGMGIATVIVKATIYVLSFEKSGGRKTPFLGYILYLLLPLISILIYFRTEDKQDEMTYLVLSFFTFFVNVILTHFLVTSKHDTRFDEESKADGAELETGKKAQKDLVKKFHGGRNRIEFISPEFVESYTKMSAAEQALVNFPVQYMYVIQEHIFKGRVTGLIDTTKVTKADYPFITDWEKMELNQALT